MHGILCLDKPQEMTSFIACACVRRALGVKCRHQLLHLRALVIVGHFADGRLQLRSAAPSSFSFSVVQCAF